MLIMPMNTFATLVFILTFTSVKSLDQIQLLRGTSDALKLPLHSSTSSTRFSSELSSVNAKNPIVFILIDSSQVDSQRKAEQRVAIRQTWAYTCQEHLITEVQVKDGFLQRQIRQGCLYAFILRSHEINKDIKYEIEDFNDIIVLKSGHEHKSNVINSLSLVKGLNPDYVIWSTDSAYINIPNLIYMLRENVKIPHRLYSGAKETVTVSNNNEESKFDFCKGPVCILSGKLTATLIAESKKSSLTIKDDFLHVAKILHNLDVKFFDLDEFKPYKGNGYYGRKLIPCIYKNAIVISNNLTPAQQRKTFYLLYIDRYDEFCIPDYKALLSS